jgi:hypothetical protein
MDIAALYDNQMVYMGGLGGMRRGGHRDSGTTRERGGRRGLILKPSGSSGEPRGGWCCERGILLVHMRILCNPQLFKHCM